MPLFNCDACEDKKRVLVNGVEKVCFCVISTPEEKNWQVDKIISDLSLPDEIIAKLMALAPDCFDDPLSNPVWYQQICYKLPRQMRNVIDEAYRDFCISCMP